MLPETVGGSVVDCDSDGDRDNDAEFVVVKLGVLNDDSDCVKLPVDEGDTDGEAVPEGVMLEDKDWLPLKLAVSLFDDVAKGVSLELAVDDAVFDKLAAIDCDTLVEANGLGDVEAKGEADMLALDDAVCVVVETTEPEALLDDVGVTVDKTKLEALLEDV